VEIYNLRRVRLGYRYVLIVDPELCDGCRRCEMICSLKKSGDVISPAKARIRVLKRETLGIDIPMVCLHCEDPICRDVCPVNAIRVDDETGAVLIDEDRCIGCRQCMIACPFGAISFDPERHICVKCDLCGGEPACVETCLWGAIKYVRADLAGLPRMQRALEKLEAATIKARKSLQGRGV